ncbi:Hint domain-containing protein [uncultured Tateyamaria sp.]|uniref:Hint domain-containing protein n=1 Tax=uncultured Tateyamaria sp. TaxID=455651 RepID=UPI00260F0F97|nr:Hint domain-containing protein [uncultured Tateyamaria sp.]
MAVFYAYTFALQGTQTTINGAPVDYAFAPNGTWSYSGDTTYFVVEENDGATVFNGDGDVNEFVDTNERFGGAWEQTAFVDGVERQIIWDYTFTVTDGTNTWRIGVIDVDLNNDNDLNDTVGGQSEDGFFLVFPDGLPPPNTDLTTGGIVENDDSTPHVGLGATVVCFAAGSQIDTPDGPVPVEHLASGDLVLTAHDGPQPVQWAGATTVAAQGDAAPIIITAGTLGNDTDLVVSPQHCILLSDWRAELLYGQDEVLVRAVDLLNMDGVYRHTGGMVTYCHILMEKHQVVSAHGIWSETLYPGSVAMGAVGPAAMAEIEALLPDLSSYGPTAAPRLRSFEARLLAA